MQLVRAPTFTMSKNLLNLILVSNTEIVGDLAILQPLPEFQHCPVVADLYIAVNDDSNSVNVRLRNKVNYAATNGKLERFNLESMCEA